MAVAWFKGQDRRVQIAYGVAALALLISIITIVAISGRSSSSSEPGPLVTETDRWEQRIWQEVDEAEEAAKQANGGINVDLFYINIYDQMGTSDPVAELIARAYGDAFRIEQSQGADLSSEWFGSRITEIASAAAHGRAEQMRAEYRASHGLPDL